MLCIFCLTEKPPGLEHVIPDALGGTLTIDRVCDECNNWLGANVDHVLTDHLFAYFGRSNYGIGNEAQLMSNIFGPGTMQMEDGSQIAVNVGGEPYEDERGARIVPTPRIQPYVDRTTNPDGTRTIRGQFDASQEHHLRALMRAEYRRLGYTFTDEEFEERYQQDVQRGSSNAMVQHQLRIDTVRFRIAMMKIIYELAWYWLGDAWLADPIAARIRDVVFGRLELDSAMIRGHVGFQPEAWPLAMLDEDAMHSAAMIPTGGGVTICLRVFTNFYAMVGVSDSANRYFPDAQHLIEHGRLLKFQRRAAREEIPLGLAIQQLVRHSNPELH